MRNTEAALLWIVGVLHELEVPFEIDGGLAAHAYGATRELADIDINIPAECMDKVAAQVKPYLTFGPAWYKDDNWDLYMMTVNYAGQYVDLGALGRIRYYDHEGKRWIGFPDELEDVRVMEYDGMRLPFINELKLMIYKQQLHRGVDRKDVRQMSKALSPE